MIPAGGKALVNTHISLAVPEGTYGRVAPRSGLGMECLIQVGFVITDLSLMYSFKAHDRHWRWSR